MNEKNQEEQSPPYPASDHGILQLVTAFLNGPVAGLDFAFVDFFLGTVSGFDPLLDGDGYRVCRIRINRLLTALHFVGTASDHVFFVADNFAFGVFVPDVAIAYDRSDKSDE